MKKILIDYFLIIILFMIYSRRTSALHCGMQYIANLVGHLGMNTHMHMNTQYILTVEEYIHDYPACISLLFNAHDHVMNEL